MLILFMVQETPISSASNAELELRVVYKWLSGWGEDLELIAAPLGIINAVDPLSRLLAAYIHPQNQMTTHVLSLNDNAAIFLDVCCLSLDVLLILLHWNGAVLANAGVDLKSSLVRLDIELDAGAWRGQLENIPGWVFRCSIWRKVVDERIVDSGASSAAEALSILDVVAKDCVRLGEVQSSAACQANCTIWNQDAIGLDIAIGVRHIQGIVQDRESLLVDKRSKVPVDVMREHDRCSFVEWDRD